MKYKVNYTITNDEKDFSEFDTFEEAKKFYIAFIENLTIKAAELYANGEKIESFTKEKIYTLDGEEYQEGSEERQEKIFYINSIYDEYLQKTEKRGLSYGELSYIENLNAEELEELENEIQKELEKLEKEAKKAD